MPDTSVPTSLATVAIATFMTEVSRVIRNWPDARVASTGVPRAGSVARESLTAGTLLRRAAARIIRSGRWLGLPGRARVHLAVRRVAMEKGFFASLFDISFTSFITTKIIKVLYVLALVVIGLVALVFVIGAFRVNAGLGVVTLFIFAPLASLFYVIYARVGLELIIQIFRITELLRDQNQLQRTAFAGAGWLPPSGSAPAPAPQMPRPSAPTAAAS